MPDNDDILSRIGHALQSAWGNHTAPASAPTRTEQAVGAAQGATRDAAINIAMGPAGNAQKMLYEANRARQRAEAQGPPKPEDVEAAKRAAAAVGRGLAGPIVSQLAAPPPSMTPQQQQQQAAVAYLQGGKR
jgi:hypothetical protein